MKKIHFFATAFFAFSFIVITSVQSADWPQWRGPNRNGISEETGWQFAWPEDGPKVLWKANLGPGCSSFAVAGDRVYTMGNDKDTGYVYCLDAKTGSVVWKQPFESPLQDRMFEGGQDSTPAVDGDFVYALGRQGQFFCLNRATGAMVWLKDFVKNFGASNKWWGYAGSPLVVGKMVIIDAGGKSASAVAFDKTNGNVLWKAGDDEQSYGSPYPFMLDGKQMVAFFNAFGLVVREVDSGKEVMRYPWKTDHDVNAATPIVSDSKIFISSGYNHGAALLPIGPGEPKPVWESKDMKNKMNSCVLWKGNLYGFDEGKLACMDFGTGALKWKKGGLGIGSLILADGKLIILSENGDLVVATATTESYHELARTKALEKHTWVCPVLANGKIFCRDNSGDVVCFDVSGK